MSDNKKLAARLPKKYWERVNCIQEESDLIDNCKYMLYLAAGWSWGGDYSSIPVKSVSEAIRFIKDSDPIPERRKNYIYGGRI